MTQNKTRRYSYKQVVSAVVIVMGLFILTFQAVGWLNKQIIKDHFNITKQECWNETILLPENADLFVTIPADSRFHYKHYINISTEWGSRYGYDYKKCENKSVDEIRIDYPCYLNKSYIESPQSCPVLFVDATKYDLTTEWLNENCQVIKVYSHISNVVYPCNKTSCAPTMDICNSKYYDCLKWSCGDYNVELIK